MAQYTLVRLDDDVQNNAVLKYNALEDIIQDSSVEAASGALKAPLYLQTGIHQLASQGEQFVTYNTASNVVYAPPWHIIDETNPGGSYDRFYGPLSTEVRFTDKSAVLENPEFIVTTTKSELIFSFTLDALEAHPDAVIYVIGPSGEAVYSQRLVIGAGEVTYNLPVPVALAAGVYTLCVVDNNTGTPTRIYGDPQTNAPAHVVTLRAYEDKPLATQEYALNLLAAPVGFEASWITQTGSDALYPLTTSLTLESLPFNTVTTPNDKITVDQANGILTFSENLSIIVELFAQGTRQSGGLDLSWGFCLDYASDGINWAPIANSSRRGVVTEINHPVPLSMTKLINVQAGSKLRVRQFTSNHLETVGILSQAALGAIPASAGYHLALVIL